MSDTPKTPETDNKKEAVTALLSQSTRGQAILKNLKERGLSISIETDVDYDVQTDVKTGTIRLNAKSSDEILMIALIEQYKRLSQNDHNQNIPENISPLSFLVQSKFAEADLRSFVAATVAEHANETGHKFVLETLKTLSIFAAASQYIDMVKEIPECDFALMRRAGFDSFFHHPELYDAQQHDIIVNLITPHLDAEHEKAYVTKEFFSNTETKKISDYLKIPAYEAISLEGLLAYGQDTLLENDRNYMTEISGPKPMDDAFYLSPSKEVLQHLQRVLHETPTKQFLKTVFKGPLKNMNPEHGGLTRSFDVSAKMIIEQNLDFAPQAPAQPATIARIQYPKAPKV